MNQTSDSSTQKPQDSYSHVLKYTGLFGGVQGLKILMNVIRTKLTAIYLGDFGMGLNAQYQNIAELINQATNFGLGFSSLRSLSELFEEGSKEDIAKFISVIRTWCLWISILGAAICLLGAPIFNYYYFKGESSHTLEIALLSLFVASVPIEMGECSILKGLHQLKRIAVVEVFATLSTLVLTIPFYYFLGFRAVAISLVCCGWAIALIHLYFCCKLYKYRVSPFSKQVFKAGLPLVRVGIPYVLTGVLGALTTSFIFNTFSSTEVVGHYKAGYGLMVTYAGMVFVAIEADFFPRLSSANHDTRRMNHVINQQIEVCLSLMTPLLILMVTCMPLIIRVLYTTAFLDVVDMATLAIFYMFFRSITTPIAYSSLAKGDSVVYFVMELIYDVVVVCLMHFAYAMWGFAGSGIALSSVALFDLIMISSTYSVIYKYRMRLSSFRLIIPQFLLLLLPMLVCALKVDSVYRYSVCLIALLVSAYISWHFMSKDQELTRRLLSRFRRGGNKCNCC